MKIKSVLRQKECSHLVAITKDNVFISISFYAFEMRISTQFKYSDFELYSGDSENYEKATEETFRRALKVVKHRINSITNL